ncbi:hypothetical protein K7X08_023150 [Anisodus acutangulus]|uniref:MADS-box domain-containing protein n=1 Tax=Anisodus acutangulus TaxID=402998 RepID=A0A9Q1LHD5_9SOLA|nr:hypothetical protein K7X08_023150 [Anisodus acutangulus]
MAEKKTLGRQKIPMAKIEKENDRYSTFSKRRSGLYKKASELIEQYDVDMGIIIFSPTGKPFSFFHPTVNSVIDSFLSPHTQPSESNLLDAVNTRDKVKELKAKLDEFDLAKDDEYNQRPMPDETDQKKWWKSIKEFDAKEPSESNLLDAVNTQDKVKELKAKLDEFDLAKDDEYNQRPMPDETDQKKWWKSIKEFDAKEVKNYLIYLESTISGLENCLMLLEKGASSSAQAPPEDAN